MPKTTTAAGMLAALALFMASACDRQDAATAGTPPSDHPALAATATPSGTAPVAGAPLPVPAGERHARLQLVDNSGTLHYSGTVDSAATRQAIVEALEQAYGARDVGGELRVDDGVQPPRWLDNLPLLMTTFPIHGAALGFSEERIELSGYASLENREALLDRVRQLYPDYRHTGLFEGIGADTAMDDASRALAALADGGSRPELVSALNQAAFRFEEHSARVDPGSLDLVSRAAAAIRAAPEGTRIGIAAPATVARTPSPLAAAAANAGEEPDIDPAFLAQQRAEAMKVQLILHGVSPARIETLPATDAGEARSSGTALHFSLLE